MNMFCPPPIIFILYSFFSITEELRFIQLLQPQIVAQVHDYLYFHCEVAYDQVLDIAFFWRHNGQVMVETEQIVSQSD